VVSRSLQDLERHLEQLPREGWHPPAPPPAPWPGERPRRTRRTLVPALAGALLLCAGISIGLLASGGGNGSDGNPVRATLSPVGGRGAGASGVVELRPRAGGTARVALSGLRPSTRTDFYELWLLGDDGGVVSLGSVRVPASGRARLMVDLPVDPRRFRYLDVSREPADGDPSHSTISVLRGRSPSYNGPLAYRMGKAMPDERS
jgi:Anti-sigma-K factor rskA